MVGLLQCSSLAPVYYNYRTHVQDLSFEGIFTLNNIRFHKQKTGMVLYGGVGFGATIYDTRINALAPIISHIILHQ